MASRDPRRYPIPLSDDEGDDISIYQPARPDEKLIPGSRDSQRSGSSPSRRTPDSRGSNYLSPNRTPSPAGRNSLPRSPSPSGRNNPPRSPSPSGRNNLPRSPSPSGKRPIRSPNASDKSSGDRLIRSPSLDTRPNGNRHIKSPDPFEGSNGRRSIKSPDPRERRKSSANENITHCSEPNCILCQCLFFQYLFSQSLITGVMEKYRQNKFSVSTGEVGNPENYNPNIHTLKKNDPNKP